MAKVASEVKAGDIKVLFVKPLVYWTRFFIIATAFSRPQIDAIGYISLFKTLSHTDITINSLSHIMSRWMQV